MTGGVIADDLTGALDGGLQIFRKGIGVTVSFSQEKLVLPAGSTGYLVIDTESRNLPAGEAVKRTVRAVSELRTLRLPLKYKKVDSTLRGNPGVEIAAILDSSSFDAALVTPALPKLGRTVKDGVLLVNGIALADTEFSLDPLAPVRNSRVSEIISKGVSLECRLISRPMLIEAADNPTRFLESHLSGRKQSTRKALVFIADCESEEDLQMASRFAAGCGGRLLPCGSAGLLECLAGELVSALPANTGTAATGNPGAAPVLIVSTSMSEVARGQIEHMVLHGGAVRVKPDSPASLTSGETAEGCGRQILSVLRKGRHVILDAGGRREELPGNRKETLDMSSRLQAFVSAVISKVFRESSTMDIGGLVLIGGETAISVCNALGAGGIRITGESEPFVPGGIMIGGAADGLPVVTKAGGFGSITVLADACSYLSNRRL